ncbi:MAG: DUF4388 domain-containing protein [Cyanobacteria bacterium NC_groundwater_1444_Ag_S-0.65um_54_12]|nr:DUF4388 domain-containing protein [Cyanobacteria bacterium NC_groundwater_1444_Ag_S-0.65um_54_12]
MIPRGSLSEFGLPDLLQIISMEAGTGSLTLAAPGRKGLLEAENGIIVGAVCGPKTGEDAVYALFLWEGGDFSWDQGIVGSLARNVTANLGDLTREGIQRRDMWRLAKQGLPSLNATFRKKAEVLSNNWDEQAMAAWDAIATGTTIGELGRRLGISPALAAHSLLVLWNSGALEAEIPSAEVAWLMFQRVLNEWVRRFADISGIRMNDGLETFLTERGIWYGLEVQNYEQNLLIGDLPTSDPLRTCTAFLAEVAEYIARLHGTDFVERAIREVYNSAALAERNALERLGLLARVQASKPGEGQ